MTASRKADRIIKNNWITDRDGWPVRSKTASEETTMKYLRNMIYPITLIEPGQEIQLEDGTFEKKEDIRYNVFASRRYFSGGEGIVSNTELATRQIEYMIRNKRF